MGRELVELRVLLGRPAPLAVGVRAEIERLAGLRDSGALTEQEFAAEKARILGSG